MRARICVAVVTVAVTGALFVQPLKGAPTHSRTRQPRVCFVPIGIDSSLLRLHSTAEWFREALGLDVVVADRLEPANAYDANRGQFVAERLAGQLATLRQQVIAMQSATVIGITDLDMYTAGYPRWHFVFSYRGDSAVAVVSYARMDPRNFGQPENEDLLQSRLRKMVAKDIGILVHGLRMTHDPRSLMYDGILGVEELDFIEEDFARAGMAPMRRP
jgi:predicted Zn-dependent protease